MTPKEREILEDFRDERERLVRLGELVQTKLEEMAKELEMPVLSIEHRVKTEQSLQEKLYRKGEKYKSLQDITDLLGARIICFFSDDVDKIGARVQNEFVIDADKSTDKRAQLRVDAFGYLSLHYICALPHKAGFPEELCRFQFEIQIRTALQHVWAAINHDIGYKSEFGVPRVITRQFSRLAGLLELADDEFVRARDAMNAYTQDTRQKIIENRADAVLIDLLSLREYMRHNCKMRAFLERLAQIEGSEIAEIDPENYLTQLDFLGKKTLGDLQQMLEEDEETAFALAYRALKGSELDLLTSNVALRFLCRADLLVHHATLKKATDFLLLSTNEKSRAQKQAEALLALCGKLGGF